MADHQDSNTTLYRRLGAREERLRSSGEGIHALFERLGGQEQMRLTALWRQWETVMGEQIASLSYPLGHKDDDLALGADDSMALQELSLLGAEILERANAFMGREFFSTVTVQLRQGRRNLAEQRTAGQSAPPAQPVFPLPRVGRLLGRLDPDSPVTRCYEAHVARARKK
jgi:Protein of unknown function (DUF721).